MMEKLIGLSDEKVIIKRYKIRQTGRAGSTLETTIPREAFEREARRLGMPPEEAIVRLNAVWRFNDFHGLHLSFEKKEKLRQISQKSRVRPQMNGYDTPASVWGTSDGLEPGKDERADNFVDSVGGSSRPLNTHSHACRDEPFEILIRTCERLQN